MTIAEKLERAVLNAVVAIEGQGYDISGLDGAVTIEPPRLVEHGDFTFNLALKAKAVKDGKPLSPQHLAELLVENMPATPEVKEWQVVKPGFINVYLSDQFYAAELERILKEKDKYGKMRQGRTLSQKVILEYLSANPTGPLTLGNSRGGYYGDALSRVLSAAGFKVHREYYVNDDPYNNTQLQLLGTSVLAELGLLEEPEERYRGEYLSNIADKVLKSAPKLKDSKDINLAGQLAAELVMSEEVIPTLDTAGIKFDSFFHESKLYADNEVQKAVEDMRKYGLVYKADGALWFKATDYGDKQDWVVRKSNGEYSYLASDIAYHLDKFTKRKFDHGINIIGADHHAHIAKTQAALKALGMSGKLSTIITQTVRLIENGKEVKMSKRAGTYVALAELIEEVGADVVRYFYLMRSPESHMDFDLDLARETSEKNPVFYLKYAHARMAGILRQMPQNDAKAEVNFGILDTPEERKLSYWLVHYPDLIERISKNYAVYHLSTYAQELAAAFHVFYDRRRVLQKDKSLMNARLLLVLASKQVLKNVLEIMGVDAPDEM